MTFDYDGLYRSQQQALGPPTAAFADFFRTCPKTAGRILDAGCGQGRDALMIARHGHKVVGIDISPAGIACMTAEARRLGLDVEGHVADIRHFEPAGPFDVVVVDRTLHMLPKTDRFDVLNRLSKEVADGGHLLIADEKSNIAEFRRLLFDGPSDWIAELERDGLFFVRRTS